MDHYYKLLTALHTRTSDNLGRNVERFYKVGTLCRILDSDGHMATIELPDGKQWRISTYFLRSEDASVQSR